MTVLDLLSCGDIGGSELSEAEAQMLASGFTRSHQVRKGDRIVQQGDPDTSEYILLSGNMVSLICDTEGREVCVGLHSGPCVITPNLARTADGNSLVSIESCNTVDVAMMPAPNLIEIMLHQISIREWANNILRTELQQKTGREWCLSALKAQEKLVWFRKHFPDHESRFVHGHIASFLGMTPVTFSRARGGAP